MVLALSSASQVLSRVASDPPPPPPPPPADSPKHRTMPFTLLNLLSLSQDRWAFSPTLAIQSFIKRKPPP